MIANGWLALLGLAVCVAGSAMSVRGHAEQDASPRAQGSVSVLYAGSLGAVMEKALGPGFQAATGFGYQGEGQGSVGAARAIRDQLRSPDVFISADPAVNQKLLMGPENHDLVRWYITLAAGELVIGSSPQSRFAADFERARTGKTPWYEVLAKPGLKFGRSDPELDPKGYRAIFLFELAEQYYHHPDIAKLLGPPQNPAQIFPEPELLARMEAGQLDAAVFYRHEVIARKIPFIELPDELNQGNPRFAERYQARSYSSSHGKVTGSPIVFTVTILRTAHNAAGATAFVRFLLGDAAQRIFKEYGFRWVPATATGDLISLPSELRALVRPAATP
jgi:molybdate/tungstate transport system substrate-binding protein